MKTFSFGMVLVTIIVCSLAEFACEALGKRRWEKAFDVSWGAAWALLIFWFVWGKEAA